MADQGSEGYLSPWLRDKRIEAVLPKLNGKVLDFGCGTGSLAKYLPFDKYLGVEIDEYSLNQAFQVNPSYTFSNDILAINEKFDSVVLLAVIEHVDNPVNLLCRLAEFIDDGQMILTTPHPAFTRLYNFGARIGLFSKHASEEHHEFLDKEKLEIIGREAGLELRFYSRFLLGANQLAVFDKGII